MPVAEARVETGNAVQYMTRLCQHAGKMSGHRGHRPRNHANGAPPEIRHTECSETDGRLVLDWGQCTLHATDGILALRAQATSEDGLTRLQDLITARLEKFGRREHLTVTWQPAANS